MPIISMEMCAVGSMKSTNQRIMCRTMLKRIQHYREEHKRATRKDGKKNSKKKQNRKQNDTINTVTFFISLFTGLHSVDGISNNFVTAGFRIFCRFFLLSLCYALCPYLFFSVFNLCYLILCMALWTSLC